MKIISKEKIKVWQNQKRNNDIKNVRRKNKIKKREKK